ncbi:MAG TPA: acyl-CoA synthetase [Acidimicrobiales bacterium]|nr:acyl-CoA synthetase [Acidimicrobiales bacterium]
MAFNLADLIEHAIDAVPERTALICGDRSITYAQLEERANRLAHHLAANGVVERQHVAIYAYNSIEFVETMLAAYKLRAVPINVNYRYVEDELVYLYDNADVVATVFQSEFCPRIAAVRDRLPMLQHLIVVGDGGGAVDGAVEYERALADASPERDFGPRDAGDLYILYTGGTTGFPKGVMWRHEDVFRTLGGGIDFVTGEWISDEYALARSGAENPLGHALVLAPLMHGAAQWTTFGALFRGTSVVLLPKFDPHDVWTAVEKYKIGGLAITGDAMARPLIEALIEGRRDLGARGEGSASDEPQAGGDSERSERSEPTKRYDVSSVYSVSSTAAVFSPVMKEQFLELLPNAFISEAVGSSESGFNGLRLLEKGATANKSGLINVNMGPDTIVLDDDNKPVKPGEVGRMARGGNVPLGYYKDPAKTAATFIEVDGKRYSVPGDLARLEEDGTMTLLGRGSQCINSGGEKIYPEEVEAALKAHPEVYDVLVVGVDDERWGQKVAAIVQPRERARPELDDLVEHCRTRIAGYKVPRALYLVDEIPRQPSGKPDYPRARKVAMDAMEVTT